jgi:DNA polymerase-4
VRDRVAVLQQAGIDEAYADLTGVERPLPMLRELVSAVLDGTGMQLSVGVGPNRLVAKIASDLGKPAGFVAIGREDCAARIAGASPRRVPGIGPKTAARLAAMGVATLGDLQGAGVEQLQEAFGANLGSELHRRAHLHDDSPVTTTRVIKSQSNETTFDVDIGDAAELEAVLLRQSGQLAEGLRRKGMRGRTIRIKVRLDDWTTVTRARTLDRYVDDAATIGAVAVELLRAYAPTRPVRLLGVGVAGFEDAAAEPEAPRVPPDQLALELA